MVPKFTGYSLRIDGTCVVWPRHFFDVGLVGLPVEPDPWDGEAIMLLDTARFREATALVG